MTTNYNDDDSAMYNMYREGLEYLHSKTSTGIDQFTPKLSRRGDPNRRLSYASYFEEDEHVDYEEGMSGTHEPTGDRVTIFDVDSKSKTVSIELPDETRMYNVPYSDIIDAD